MEVRIAQPKKNLVNKITKQCNEVSLIIDDEYIYNNGSIYFNDESFSLTFKTNEFKLELTIPLIQLLVKFNNDLFIRCRNFQKFKFTFMNDDTTSNVYNKFKQLNYNLSCRAYYSLLFEYFTNNWQ